MEGTSQHTFSPSDGSTRGQAAAILCRYLDLNAPSPKAEFSDIFGHWAEKEIRLAADFGVLKGYPDGTFQPNRAVTREEIAVILQRILQYEYTGEKAVSFPDVSQDRWSYNEITALIGSGL